MDQTMAPLEQPNDYVLSGDGVTVHYRALCDNLNLRYEQGEQRIDAGADQIRTQVTELGTEVSVTLESVADLRTITFTVLIPTIHLGAGQFQTEAATVAIATTNRTTIDGSASVVGSLQTYRVLRLNGTAAKMR
jgi:hypothetical protein